MDTNIQTEKTTAKKVAAKKTPVETDPFASAVEEIPAKKRVTKKATQVKVDAAQVKKTVKKASKEIVLDPFAEVVDDAVSPVKKRVAKVVKPVAKKPAKTAKKNDKVDGVVKPKPVRKSSEKVESAVSPVFEALADVILPELPRENRARLQMQTPTRLYFYWSVKENPWALLKNVFGDDLGSYSLVLKLVDKKHGHEDIHPTDAAGNYWFDVDADGSYQAEIGFYAPNRPYFRILHSNTVDTPRRSPSPRAATDADWKVTSYKFAEVLDVAGFSRDAFDVAIAGDDYVAATGASNLAFARFLGTSDFDLLGITAEDIRYAMLALASGARLEDLRFKVSNALFAILSANADKLEAAKAMSALGEYFEINESEVTEEQIGPAVFGASLVNFPRTLTTRGGPTKIAPDYSPVSSHSYR